MNASGAGLQHAAPNASQNISGVVHMPLSEALNGCSESWGIANINRRITSIVRPRAWLGVPFHNLFFNESLGLVYAGS
jgi:hypothetical protein